MGRQCISFTLFFLSVGLFSNAKAQSEAAADSSPIMKDTIESWTRSCQSTSCPEPFAYYGGSLSANASTSADFAPYYIVSDNEGLITQANALQANAFIYRPICLSKRFDYGFGADIAGTWSSGADYARYIADDGWAEHDRHYPGFIIHKLYGRVKFRGVFATLGAAPHHSTLFDNNLETGDIIMSNNARPIPQLRVGFIDFQNIPFTKGWVQIKGEVAYGKFTDSSWLESHYNHYNSFITTGSWMQHSDIYFRTNPNKPFSATIGMQHATQFGGTWQVWDKGQLVSSHKTKLNFKSFLNAFIPSGNSSSDIEGEKYKEGNHLGSYDIRLRYRFDNSSELSAYAQLPWEDGSGMGKLNGFDGVWGLEYRFYDANIPGGWIKSVVAEYIDFTNQSGPTHWAPGDFPGTQIPGQATGADDYYNNFMYNGWANYGMAIGSPFVKSTVYNTDGYLRFTDNRVRGFQLGATGHVADNLSWTAKFSYRTSWGTPMVPQLEKLRDTSMLLECKWRIPNLKGLSLAGKIAFDAGKLYGNNFGALVSLRYDGEILFRKHEK